MSGLAPVRGHDRVRRQLAAALLRAELAPGLLFVGPAGVGKQRVALWLAQLRLCERPTLDGPCGQCRPCRLVLRLEHPDVHWFFPLARPKVSGGAERLGEALEDARAVELAARREDPYYTDYSDEPSGIYLAHAQVIRRMAGSRPAMAAHKVFVIGNADLLVPQEASPEAANALLKLLEEPPTDTTLILTTSEADALLPTIRSRLLPVRFAALPEAEVTAFLQEVRQLNAAQAGLVARLSQGSIGRALAFLPQGSDAGPLEAARQRACQLLDAALDLSSPQRFALALAQQPYSARGDFSATLEFLTLWLRDLAAVAAGAPEAVVNADAVAWLQQRADAHPAAGEGAAGAILAVQHVQALTQFNINPQVALGNVVRTVGEHLRLAPGGLAGISA